MRKRLPFVAFILLLLLLVLCVGLAYACTNDHPGQAVEQAVAAAQPVPLVEVYSLVAVVLLMGAVYSGRRRTAAAARSPAMLQRLLL